MRLQYENKKPLNKKTQLDHPSHLSNPKAIVNSKKTQTKQLLIDET